MPISGRSSYSYFERIADGQVSDAHFFSRADNLSGWLTAVESRLGNFSQRLSTSVGQRRINAGAK